MIWRNHCLYCDVQFETEDARADVCPKCEDRERRQFAENDGLDLDLPPRKYSRAWHQERLGVSGDKDE